MGSLIPTVVIITADLEVEPNLIARAVTSLIAGLNPSNVFEIYYTHYIVVIITADLEVEQKLIAKAVTLLIACLKNPSILGLQYNILILNIVQDT